MISRILQELPATVRFVPPSGDKTGATDYASLSAALKELAFPGAPTDTQVGTLLLGGDYFVNDVLTCGSKDGKFVCVDGMGHSRLAYTGSKTDKPLLSFIGGGRQRATLCSNLRIDGNGMRCRGIHFDAITYQELLRNTYTFSTRQLAVNARNCWGCSLNGLTVDTFSGMAFFADQWNAGLVESLYLRSGFGCWFTGESPTSSKSKEVQAYEVANGKKATEAQYGPNYAQDWPDELVLPENRGLVCIFDGAVQNWQGLCIEGCHPCEYPSMFNYGSGIKLSGMYAEGNSHRNAPFVICGQEKNPNWCTTLSHIRDCSPVGPTGCRRSLVELRGTTYGVRVLDSVAYKLGTAVTYAATGTHYGAGVTRFIGSDPRLSPYNWIEADPAATLLEWE